MQSNFATAVILVPRCTIGFKADVSLVLWIQILFTQSWTKWTFYKSFFFSFLRWKNFFSIGQDEKIRPGMMPFFPFQYIFFRLMIIICCSCCLLFKVYLSLAVTSWTAPRPKSTGSMYSSVGETTTPTTLKDTHAQSTLTTLPTTWVSTPLLLGCSSVLTWLTIFTGKKSGVWMLVMLNKPHAQRFLWIVTYSFEEKRLRDKRRSVWLVTYSLGRICAMSDALIARHVLL